MSKKALFVLILVGALVGQVAFADEKIPTQCTIRRAEAVHNAISDCPAHSGPGVETCVYEPAEGETAYPCGLCCLMGTVFYVTDLVFIVLIVLVMIFVLLGAFSILTAGGSGDKINKGRDYILWAAIGFAVALLAKAVPGIVKFLLA